MAHQINIERGIASAIFANTGAWHGLGTVLPECPSVDKALELAHLDFKVEKLPLFTVIPNEDDAIMVDGKFATVRMDTKKALGVVGSVYEVMQNKDAFAVVDEMLDKGMVKVETAGALGSGERVWLLANLPGYLKVKTPTGYEDLTNKYLLFFNSHDGSTNIRVKLTPIRVVCANTLAISLRGVGDEVKIRHTRTAQDRLKQANETLKIVNTLYADVQEMLKPMALKKFTDKDFIDYFKKLIPEADTERAENGRQQQRGELMQLVETGKGAKESGHTLWTAYNAVVEKVDHYAHVADPLKNSWFGGGYNLKLKAFEIAKAIITKN